MLLFLILGVLPFLEIAGFIIIGGDIGIGHSLLWLIADVVAGFYLLATMGRQTMISAMRSVEEDVYPLKEVFDGICILIGAFLLIFPGFVSDFLSVVFIFPPFRYGLFLFLKSQHESFLEEFTRKGEGFAGKYYESNGEKTIEGEFTVIKDDGK